MTDLSRRAFLGGALGLAAGAGTLGLVQADVLPGRIPLDRALGRCGEPPPVPDASASVMRSSFVSDARQSEVRYLVARPDGVEGPLPVCLVLHGRGATAATAFDALHWHRHLAAAVAGGTPPYALVSVDGGESYWHARAGGDDPQRMLLEELLPRLAREGLPTERFAVAGWSIGGYGALLLAQRLGARVAAVAALSAALWRSYDDATPGAFDSAADFAAHDVLAAEGQLRGRPLWVRCGRSDPFAAGNRQLLAAVPGADGGITKGCHDDAYWRREATPMLEWLGRRLAG